MLKKISTHCILGATAGVTIGLLLSVVISYILKLPSYSPAPPRFTALFQQPLDSLTVSIAIWTTIGIMFACASLIFTEMDWSITKMTIVHLCITYFLFVPLSILAGWHPFSPKDIFNFTLYFVIIYSIIWGLSMVTAKKEIKKSMRNSNK